MSSTKTISIKNSSGIVQVQISRDSVSTSLNGKPLDSYSLPPQEINDLVHPASPKIWYRYEQFHSGHLVIRSGFGLYGVYGKSYSPLAPPDNRHPESDTEHAAGCVGLMHNLRLYYPELLPCYLYDRAEQLLVSHDLGEGAYGDRADDGSQDKAEKNRVELINFAVAAAHLPEPARTILIEDFIRFQDPLCPYYPLPIAQMIQLARTVDKFEAVLSGLTYEKAGIKGDLSYKAEHHSRITPQDTDFAAQAHNDTSLVGVWSAHIIHDYHMYYGFPYLLDVLKAAVIDVRGDWFPWFDEFCQLNQIPASHVTHPCVH